MREYLLKQVPRASRSWVESLVATADDASFARFVQWHSRESLDSLFTRLPPWAPPLWNEFIRYGIPDWPPVVQGETIYLSPREYESLRELAWEIAGETLSRGEAAYRIFCWVSEHIEWSATWGAATPLEIAARQSGSSFHIAQLVVALCRVLFIPARLVEEVAFVPRLWLLQAEYVWRDAPVHLRTWLGARTFFHPLCEVRIENNWQPVDAQRSQFGRAEVQQHLRVPQLLKVAVRAWDDYRRRIDRIQEYTLRPLIGTRKNRTALDFRDSLRAIGQAMSGHLEESHGALFDASDLLDRVQIQASSLWQERSGDRCFVLALDTALPPGASINLQAAVASPLVTAESLDQKTKSTRMTLIFIGSSVARVLAPSYQDRLRAGAKALLLYESWGEGEAAIRFVLSTMKASLDDWVSPPGNGQNCQRIQGAGCLAPIIPRPCTLDLTLARRIKLPAGSDGSIIANDSTQGGERTVGATVPVGQGRLTLMPISVAALADPYGVSVLSGFHRRVLGNLANL